MTVGRQRPCPENSPPARSSPPQKLRQRASLRCPPRLAPQQNSDSDGGAGRARSGRPPERRAIRKGTKKSAVTVSGVSRGGGDTGSRPLKRQSVEQRAPVPTEEMARARAEVAAYYRPQVADQGILRRTGTRGAGAVNGAVGGGWQAHGTHGEAALNGVGHNGGFIRSLPADGLEDRRRAVNRVVQRPQWQGSSRPAIPADAVIVEVGIVPSRQGCAITLCLLRGVFFVCGYCRWSMLRDGGPAREKGSYSGKDLIVPSRVIRWGRAKEKTRHIVTSSWICLRLQHRQLKPCNSFPLCHLFALFTESLMSLFHSRCLRFSFPCH